MADLASQFHLVGKLMILMGTGVFSRKKRILAEGGKRRLTNLIIDLVLPCSIVASFFTEEAGTLSVKKIVTHPCIAAEGIGILPVSAPPLVSDCFAHHRIM